MATRVQVIHQIPSVLDCKTTGIWVMIVQMGLEAQVGLELTSATATGVQL
jgi:hypothetical protein